MNFDIDDYEEAVDLLQKIFLLSENSAQDVWSMVERVVKICLWKHVGHDKELDLINIKKSIVCKLRDELDKPTYFDNLERCSVQTCIIVFSREIALNYVRNAYYYKSSICDIFRAMNVDVTGAEECLDDLDEMFSPSQKCVLRLLYSEGCTIHQAAGMLGISPNEVRTLEYQAMEGLKREWKLLRSGGNYQ